MDVAITKISSKGQIVIPSSMRKDLMKGDQFLIIKEDQTFIIKKITGLAKDLTEDLKFAQRVEHAWTDFEKGKFKALSAKKFLEELEKC